MFAFRVVLCFLLYAISPELQLLCVYIGMFADWAFRSVMNIFRYRSGKWLHKKLI
jgi:Na+-driven multidrug efflux pump